MAWNCPGESISASRFEDLVGTVVTEGSEFVACAIHIHIVIAVNPERVVIDSKLEALCLALCNKVSEFAGAIVSHISLGLLAVVRQHGHKSIGHNHIIAIRQQVGGNPVYNPVPLVGGHIYGHVGILFGFAAVFIYRPVHRSLVGVDFSIQFRQVRSALI